HPPPPPHPPRPLTHPPPPYPPRRFTQAPPALASGGKANHALPITAAAIAAADHFPILCRKCRRRSSSFSSSEVLVSKVDPLFIIHNKEPTVAIRYPCYLLHRLA